MDQQCGGSVNAERSNDNHWASGAIDSDPETFWHAFPSSYWNYTFGKPKALRKITVTFKYFSHIREVEIKGKLFFGNDQWKELERLNGKLPSADLSVDIPDTNDEQMEHYQAIRIAIKAAEGGYVGLRDVQFFEGRCMFP